MNTNTEKFYLFSLFFVALIVRLIFFYSLLGGGSKSWILVDSEHYVTLSKVFMSGDFIHPLSFLRLPGYPLFLTLCYSIFGASLHYALLVQIVLASCIPLLMYLLSKTLFPKSESIATIIGWYSTIHFGFILYAGILSTESLFIVILLLFFISFFKGLQSTHTLVYFFLAGLFLGISSVIRPVGHYLLIVTCLLLLSMHHNWLTKGKQILTLSTSWLLVAGIWLLRNALLTGHIFFHTLPGQHFLQYSAAYVYQDVHHVSYVEARRHLMQKLDEAIIDHEHYIGKKLNQYELCSQAEKIAYKQLTDHPLLALKHSIIHMSKSCIAPQSQLLLHIDQEWPSYHPSITFLDKAKRFIVPTLSHYGSLPLIYWDLLCHFFLWLGALTFIIRQLWYKKVSFTMISCLLFSVLFIAITLAYGSARLRLPIEPFLIIFASMFWFSNKRKSPYEVP